MAEVEHMIQIYHTGKIVCFSVAAIFFVVSVALFFLFRIPSIFSARTGRGRKKAVRQMQEINAKTGRLRRTEEMEVPGVGIRTNVKITGKASPEPQTYSSGSYGGGPQSSAPFDNTDFRKTKSSEETDILPPGEENTALLSAGMEETALLQHGDAAETELLQQSDSETALLQPEYGETGLLNITDRLQLKKDEKSGKDENPYPIRFVIEKSIMVVNSNEII